MKNKNIIKRWFERSIITPESRCKHYENIHYYGRTLLSYDTAIAKCVRGRDGSFYCLMSSYGHSSTTKRHIYMVQDTCPYPIIPIPTKYNRGHINIDTVIEELMAILTKPKTIKDLRRAADRREFLRAYYSLQRIGHLITDIPPVPPSCEKFIKMAKVGCWI